MKLASRQTGEDEFFAHTPTFEPLKGLRNPKSNKKDWDTLLHLIYFIYLLLVTIYLIIKLSITYNFSACRKPY